MPTFSKVYIFNGQVHGREEIQQFWITELRSAILDADVYTYVVGASEPDEIRVVVEVRVREERAQIEQVIKQLDFLQTIKYTSMPVCWWKDYHDHSK